MITGLQFDTNTDDCLDIIGSICSMLYDASKFSYISNICTFGKLDRNDFFASLPLNHKQDRVQLTLLQQTDYLLQYHVSFSVFQDILVRYALPM